MDREYSLRLEERLHERTRIARELHDTLFQGFLGAALQIEVAAQQVPEDSPFRTSLSRALGLIRRVVDEGRGVLSGLHSSPIDSMNLEQALCALRDEFVPPGKVQFRVFVKGQPKSLSQAIREQLYLIGREALVNALRHSQATKIEAEIEYLPRRVKLIVRDNGCGMDPGTVRLARTHWGLSGMRERAASIGAQLRIWSRLGAGTEVEVCASGPTLVDLPA